MKMEFVYQSLHWYKKGIGTTPGWTLLLFFLCCQPDGLIAQTVYYTQFTPEFKLNRAFSDKWAGELDLNNTFSNTPSQDKVFKTVIQGSGLLWAHYFLSPRWKISSNLAYYYNHDSPEIGQYESKEWRIGLQGNYYIHKIGYILLTRMRAEARFISNDEGIYEDMYRYRQMLKYMKTINSQVLRQGVFYAIASEEIVFRTKYQPGGMHYFDRNVIAIGGGYMINDNLQLELTYSNEYLPRDKRNEMNNLFTVTFTTNNLFTAIKGKIGGLFTQPDE